MSLRRFAFAIPVALLSLSCGGGGGALVQPKDYKGTDALGGDAPVCKGAPAFARPLTVDLDSDTRSDLQASTKKGVVVVAYDCVHLRVLSNCTVPVGNYEYAAVDRTEDIVHIKGMDDLKVNLPIGAAKLSSEVAAGRSIDVALVAIGRQTTTVIKVAKSEISGQCEGATHYLQKAFLGAFALTTNSSGKVEATAEMFSRSVSGSSSSEKSAGHSAGSLEACRKAEADSPTPTPECRSALRVELTPLVDDGKGAAGEAQASAPAKKSTVEVEANPCREGYKFVDGVCTNQAAAVARGFLCDPKDEASCKAECAKGNMGSCANAGGIIMSRAWKFGLAKVNDEARPLVKKACDAGDQAGCALYFRATFPTEEEAPKKKALIKELLAVGKKACDAGASMACHDLGQYLSPLLFEKIKIADKAASTHYFERGCILGYSYSCTAAGSDFLKAGDSNKGIAMYSRGCDAGDGFTCNQLASKFIKGKDHVPQDAPRGMALARRACAMSIEDCEYSADLLNDGGKPEEALARAKRGCEDPDNRTGLDEGEKGRAQLQRAHACFLLGKFYTDGIGAPKDVTRAKAAFAAGCKNGDTRACDRK